MKRIGGHAQRRPGQRRLTRTEHMGAATQRVAAPQRRKNLRASALGGSLLGVRLRHEGIRVQIRPVLLGPRILDRLRTLP